MEDIKKWLESKTPDYTAGVMLFAKHNKSKAVFNWLTRIGEKRGMSKLRYELEKIAKINPITKRAVPKQNNDSLPTQRVIIDVEGKIRREDLPETLQILYDKNVEDYKLFRIAHLTMSIARSENKRIKLRKQVAEFDDAIAKRWEVIDEWVKTNELPDELNTEVDNIIVGEDDKLTPQQVNAFRTYISRSIAEPDKIDDAKREKVQQRISAMILDGQSFDESTIESLTKLGFNISKKD